MVPFERVLVSSYRPSIFLYQHLFARNFRLQFEWGLRTPNPREGKARGGMGSGMVPFERALVNSYRLSIVGLTFYRAIHFSANARYWDRKSSVRLSVCDVGGL